VIVGKPVRGSVDEPRRHDVVGLSLHPRLRQLQAHLPLPIHEGLFEVSVGRCGAATSNENHGGDYSR
jgi:hypothetical protein